MPLAAPLENQSASRRGVLSEDQISSFFENGYLVLPKLFSDEEVAAVNAAVDRAWSDRSIYNNLTVSAFTADNGWA